ncbi:unnamed protein product [Angiostrongylus costaricensis]|uniref:Uncharacterized protein n=1 Tax=Angiostrongylus costaricensis TaxID=334426 RepID=A0A0R3PTV9_ANGCS|nr:unnamed protein product [Angiostrongylus costaricensis]
MFTAAPGPVVAAAPAPVLAAAPMLQHPMPAYAPLTRTAYFIGSKKN